MKQDDKAKVVRETTAQWDDVPVKVVGRRHPPVRVAGAGDALQRLANEMGGGKVYWPRGVYRFRSHEEADAWWTQAMKIRR